jgi:hypothetical protein
MKNKYNLNTHITVDLLKSIYAYDEIISWFKEYCNDNDTAHIVLNKLSKNNKFIEARWIIVMLKLTYNYIDIDHRFNYKNGKPHGLWEEFNQAGNISSRFNYKNGYHHGICEKFNQAGNISSRFNYKNDKLHGICEIFNQAGNLESKSTYKDGKIKSSYSYN